MSHPLPRRLARVGRDPDNGRGFLPSRRISPRRTNCQPMGYLRGCIRHDFSRHSDDTARFGPEDRRAYCDDDMCNERREASLARLNRAAVRTALRYDSFTRANHGTRSAKGASVYLVDERNHRFLPVPELLRDSIRCGRGARAIRKYVPHIPRPSDAHKLAFARGMDHLQYASFIIGNGDLFHNPRLKLRLPINVGTRAPAAKRLIASLYVMLSGAHE